MNKTQAVKFVEDTFQSMTGVQRKALWSAIDQLADAESAKGYDRGLASQKAEIERLRAALEASEAERDGAIFRASRATDRAHDLTAIVEKFMDYADSEYVPNALFDRARAALSETSNGKD